MKIKDVKGYEDTYEIQSDGVLFTKPRRFYDSLGRLANIRRKVRRPKLTQFGYHAITLIQDRKNKTHFVHRLVFETFCHPIASGFQINHKDGNKLNNSLDNLEAVTQTENIRHAYRTGLMKGNTGKFTKTLLTLDQKRAILNSKDTKRKLARDYNVNEKTIYNIRRYAHHITD